MEGMGRVGGEKIENDEMGFPSGPVCLVVHDYRSLGNPLWTERLVFPVHFPVNPRSDIPSEPSKTFVFIF